MTACHKERSIFDRLPLHLVQSRCREQRWSSAMVQQLMRHECEAGRLELEGERIRLSDNRPNWSRQQRTLLRDMLAPLKGNPPVIDLRLLSQGREAYGLIEELLLWERWLVALTPDLLVHHTFINHICAYLAERFAGAVFAVGDLKEAFGLTRKYAIPLLEYLDKMGCTQRREEGRLWIAATPPRIQSHWLLPGDV